MFSKKEFREHKKSLTDKTLNELNGKFSFYPSKRFGKHFENNESDSLKYTNSFAKIINYSWNERNALDSTLKKDSHYSISINIIASQKLHISLLENGIKIKDTIYNGKLKNGMFYIENKYLKCTGVPYIFGGCQNNKRRIGLSKNDNLIINEAISNEGAILLIIGAGYSYNSSFEFKRLE